MRIFAAFSLFLLPAVLFAQQEAGRATALVGRIHKSTDDTAFPKHGRYTLVNANGEITTGLPLLVFDANIIRTSENRVSVIFEKSARLALDVRTTVQLGEVMGIGELSLSQGRMRLQVPGGGFNWIVRTEAANIQGGPGADVVIDLSDAHTLRIFSLGGAVTYATAARPGNPVEIKEGHSVSLPFVAEKEHEIPYKNIPPKMEPIAEETATMLKNTLELSDSGGGDYQAMLNPVNSFSYRSDLDWPLPERRVSGISCPFCSYVFGEEESAKEFCPNCFKQIKASSAIPAPAPAPQAPPPAAYYGGPAPQ